MREIRVRCERVAGNCDGRNEIGELKRKEITVEYVIKKVGP